MPAKRKANPTGVNAAPHRPIQVLTPAEVAALLGITTDALNAWRLVGRGPVRRSTGDYVSWEVHNWAAQFGPSRGSFPELPASPYVLGGRAVA